VWLSTEMGPLPNWTVQAHGEGATAHEILNYLSHRNSDDGQAEHRRAALQRHRRAGRLENRDQRWYLPS
jgi:hypothetical protein